MNASGWVYRPSNPYVYTVGFYDPSGAWHPDSDHGLRDLAAERVRWLNGGAVDATPTIVGLVDACRAGLEACERSGNPITAAVLRKAINKAEGR